MIAFAAFAHVSQVKQCMDKVNDVTKTMSYIIFKDRSMYSTFSVDVQFVSVDKSSDVALTKVIWTNKYERVRDVDPHKHLKTITIQLLMALERAIDSKKSLMYTKTMNSAPDAI